jgi:hypothetical protein
VSTSKCTPGESFADACKCPGKEAPGICSHDGRDVVCPVCGGEHEHVGYGPGVRAAR